MQTLKLYTITNFPFHKNMQIDCDRKVTSQCSKPCTFTRTVSGHKSTRLAYSELRNKCENPLFKRVTLKHMFELDVYIRILYFYILFNNYNS
jgi:hypothetical protein